MHQIIIWIGILISVSQSATFSGLNLAFFSLSRLQLEIDAKGGNKAAEKILLLRQDANFLLTTILWGNVAVNVLLTLLSGSVMTGLSAFVFSTVIITFLGEICPQAYFSRNALKMASFLAPLIRAYQLLLYPVAKPSAIMLDFWLGKEGISYLQEKDLKAILHTHVKEESTDLNHVEGFGAINFLAIDDVQVCQEGELIDEASIIVLPAKDGIPEIPEISCSVDDPFLKRINRSGKGWVVITDQQDKPLLVVDADGCLRDALYQPSKKFVFSRYCHRPIFVTDPKYPLGKLIFKLKVQTHGITGNDHVIDNDVILLWSDEKRIITGADLFGRLLKGVRQE